MDQGISGLPDYQTLQNNGLKLSQGDFNTILKSVTDGIDDVKRYLSITEAGPKISITDEISQIGFATKTNTINIRLDYLNLTANNATKLEFRDQMACFVPDKFFVILKYLYWLRLLGRESAIHYYQKIGNPLLHVEFPDAFPEDFSLRKFLLSDIEVEARQTTNAVALLNNENPPWKNVDAYLSQNFSEHYNKPIEYLVAAPKPDLQISFEIENILSS